MAAATTTCFCWNHIYNNILVLPLVNSSTFRGSGLLLGPEDWFVGLWLLGYLFLLILRVGFVHLWARRSLLPGKPAPLGLLWQCNGVVKAALQMYISSQKKTLLYLETHQKVSEGISDPGSFQSLTKWQEHGGNMWTQWHLPENWRPGSS